MTDAVAILEEAFELFALPPDASQWLLDLWHVTQVFDDVADGDLVNRAALDGAIWKGLVGMPANPFFIAHASTLLPLVATAIMKWKASDTAERAGKADEKSFVWRAAYYDVVMCVVMLCHHSESAMALAGDVMALYGEKFSDYRAEFSHA
jgi:hypothetical protein